MNLTTPFDDIGQVLANMKRISLPDLSEISFKGDSAALLPRRDRSSDHYPSINELQCDIPHRIFICPPTHILHQVLWYKSNAATYMVSSEQTLDHWPHFSPFHIVSIDRRQTYKSHLLKESATRSPMLSVADKLRLDLNGDRWHLMDEEDATWLNSEDLDSEY